MSAAPTCSIISSALTKRLLKMTCRGHATFHGQRLQFFPVPLTLPPPDVRMRRSGNDIHQVCVLCEDRRQRPDYVFDSLIRGQQAERKQNRFSFGAKLILEVIGIRERKIGHSMWNQIDLLSWHLVHIAQKAYGVFAHHNQTIGKMGDLVEHGALIWVRFAQDGVKRRHQRHLQSTQHRQYVAARAPSEDAVFVLHADEIVAIEVKKIRRALVRKIILLVKLYPYLFGILIA